MADLQHGIRSRGSSAFAISAAALASLNVDFRLGLCAQTHLHDTAINGQDGERLLMIEQVRLI